MIEDNLSNQYLTFKVDQEYFAISVSNIREVLEFTSVTNIPGMPEFMKGIINVRGSVVPVLDLKKKFNLGQTEKSIDTSVIVTEIKIEDDEVVIGLITDSVSEVVEINAESIEPVPRIGTSIDSSFIQGMGKKGKNFVIILNIKKVLSTDELESLASESLVSN
jgi:purine-binding chemotaxis protein CheW